MSIIKGKCSIIILSYNQVEFTKNCLESIRRYTTCPYELIVVDNASNEETVTYLEVQEDIILIKNQSNQGFAGGCNQGMQRATGEYIMLLNNDTIVTYHWLENMVDLMESSEEISLVGPLTNNTVGKQKIEVPYDNNLDAMQEFAKKLSVSQKKPWRTLRLVAFCVLIRRSVLDEIGMLDTEFKIGNYEDDDFCIRALLKNKSLYICRRSFVHHYMNISFTKNNVPREEIMLTNKLLLEKKWNGMDWNHHAVTNEWMIQKVLMQEGESILHIGCGLGAVSIELKDNNPGYHIVGVEDHPIRKKIAQQFLDESYDWDKKLNFLSQIGNRQYDTIIVECMVEKSGMELLERLKPLLQDNGQILLRIFNIRHITTLERLVTGMVGGNLLCASSNEFCYYYDKDVRNDMIDKYEFDILSEVDVRKTFTNKQGNLIDTMNGYPDYVTDAGVYNRLYLLKAKRN